MTDDVTQTTLVDGPDDSADTSEVESNTGSTSPSEQQADSQVSVVSARGYDDWVAEREAAEEPFAVCHVTVQIASNLSGTRYSLRSHQEIRYPGADVEHGKPTPRFGTGGITATTVITPIRDWLLEILAYPYVPNLADEAVVAPVRTIPATNCRVFVADRIYDVLRDSDDSAWADALQVAVNTLNSLPEHASPPAEYCQTVDALNDIYKQIGHGATRGSLQTRERDIEQTIRARCGFTTRYGHEIPDPVPEFSNADLNSLHEQLETTRTEIEKLETRADALSDDLSAYREEWQAAVSDELDALLVPLQSDGDGYPEHVGLSERCPVCGCRYGGSLVESAGPCDECMITPGSYPAIDWTLDTINETGRPG